MIDSEENFVKKEIRFSSDAFDLSGILHLPPVHKPPVVIGSHGLLSSKDSPKQIALAEACNRLGMAYFRFDHRGCGSSQGEFSSVTSLAFRCKDLKSAAAVIRSLEETGDRIGLFGSSMGGTVSLATAMEIGAGPIVTFAAPVFSRTLRQLPARRSHEPADVIFFDHPSRTFDITEKLGQIKNILIIHGDSDETVALSHAQTIFRLAGEPKKLLIQPSGDHRMSSAEHQREFLSAASQWLKRGFLYN